MKQRNTSTFNWPAKAIPTNFESPRLFSVEATRQHEKSIQQPLAPHALIEAAGLAVARLAIAIAPHAQCIWIICGPGNNGGDGLFAAQLLQQWGKQVSVTHIATSAEITPPGSYDLCIDALFGIGLSRAPDERYVRLIQYINKQKAPRALRRCSFWTGCRQRSDR